MPAPIEVQQALRAKWTTILYHIRTKGMTLERVCKKSGYPAADTVRKWVKKDESGEMGLALARAREEGRKVQAAKYGNRVAVIGKKVEKGTLQPRQGAVAAQCYQWSASKLDAHRWGDRQIIEQRTELSVNLGANLAVGDSVSLDPLLASPDLQALGAAKVVPLPSSVRKDGSSDVDGGVVEVEARASDDPPGGDE